MKLTIFEIPENTADWPKWLEKQLMGMNLGGLVIQLEVLAENQPHNKRTLKEICGSALPELLQSGLDPLTTQQISALFQNPRTLLELQEQVLVSGGSYWDQVQVSAQDRTVIERSTARAIEAIKREAVRKPAGIVDDARFTTTQTSSNNWLSGKGIASLAAIAAALLVIVGIWSQRGSKPTGWGFDQPNLLSQNVSARKYFSNLSNAAGEWGNKRPANAKELEKRLAEFRHGCDTLIAAPHTPLDEVERKWLIDKCKSWAKELDNYLAALKQDSSKYQDVQKKADETIERLKNALKDRALKLT